MSRAYPTFFGGLALTALLGCQHQSSVPPQPVIDEGDQLIAGTHVPRAPPLQEIGDLDWCGRHSHPP